MNAGRVMNWVEVNFKLALSPIQSGEFIVSGLPDVDVPIENFDTNLKEKLPKYAVPASPSSSVRE